MKSADDAKHIPFWTPRVVLGSVNPEVREVRVQRLQVLGSLTLPHLIVQLKVLSSISPQCAYMNWISSGVIRARILCYWLAESGLCDTPFACIRRFLRTGRILKTTRPKNKAGLMRPISTGVCCIRVDIVVRPLFSVPYHKE